MPAHAIQLDQNLSHRTNLLLEPRRLRPRGLVPQPRRAALHNLARKLGHARGGGAGAWRIREDMRKGDGAIPDQRQRIGEHRLVLGRKARNQVRPDRNLRPQSLQPRD